MALTVIKWVIILYSISTRKTLGFRCDRRPYGTTTQSSPADGRFNLEVVDGHAAYLPDQLYIGKHFGKLDHVSLNLNVTTISFAVQIVSTDSMSRFTGFMISAEGDLKPDPRNPRRMISQYPGEIRPQSQNTAKFSDRCLYSVEHALSNYKDEVQVN